MQARFLLEEWLLSLKSDCSHQSIHSITLSSTQTVDLADSEELLAAGWVTY